MCLIPSSTQNPLNFALSNCLPLSVIIVHGIPNGQIIFHNTKFRTLASLMVASGSASAHLVK